MENIFDSISHAQNRDTTALQNLVATQTMERTNALHAYERSQAVRKSHRGWWILYYAFFAP